MNKEKRKAIRLRGRRAPLFLDNLSNRKTVLSLSLVLVFLLSNLSTPIINAVNEGEGALVYEKYNYNINKNPTNKFVETTNGKMVWVQIKPGITFYFSVYLDTTQTANVSYTYTFAAHTATIIDYSMIEGNANEIILIAGIMNIAATSHYHVVVLKFNILNNLVTMYEHNIADNYGLGTYNIGGYISEIMLIGTKYYAVIHSTFCDAVYYNFITMINYDNVITISHGVNYNCGNTQYIAPVFGFLNEVQDHYYFITSYTSDSTARYFDAIISTLEIVLLATEGLAGHFLTDSTKTNFMYGLGGGIITNGSIITMYFAYTRTYNYFTGGYYINSIKFEQHRITFNTTIGPTTVLEQQDRTATLEADNSYVIHHFPSFGWEINQTSYIIHYINDLGENYGGYQYAKGIIWITDWYNMSGGGIGTTIDTDMRDNPEFGMNTPYYTGYIGIKPISRYVVRYSGTSSVRIYLIEPLTVIWDMIMSYTPADSPLYTLTSYLFEFYITGNGAGRSDCILEVYVDGHIYDTLIPEGGHVDFIYLTSVRGIHTFNFILKDITLTEVINEEINYLFTNISGGGVEEGLITMNLEFIIGLIPTVLCLGGFGGIFFYVTNHWIGFLAGLTIGCLVAIVANILPIYALFIIVLVDLMIIMFMRGNTSGG